MKIGFFNPYFDSLGGGERYSLTLARHWSSIHDVCIFWDNEKILTEAENRFHLDLSKVTIHKNIFRNEILGKIKETSKFDVIFILSDGSIPTSFARHNILHFQVPFPAVSYPFWKRALYGAIVCNSQFTKRFIDQSVGVPASVIYPPVETGLFKTGTKENMILSVGRFSSHHQAKKQEVLIDAFQTSTRHQIFPKDVTFVLAGGVLSSDQGYFESLQLKAKGCPIQFFPNCSFIKLQELYSRSSVYWHAAGFGETNPQNFEHFGISTVEAMASGTIPVVFDGGGQSEIIRNGIDGYLWKTTDEMIKISHTLFDNPRKVSNMRTDIRKRAEVFDVSNFLKSFDLLLDHMTP